MEDRGSSSPRLTRTTPGEAHPLLGNPDSSRLTSLVFPLLLPSVGLRFLTERLVKRGEG